MEKMEKMNSLTKKLEPNRHNYSPAFTAIVAYILGESWTQPEIAEMAITSDGFVLVRHDDEIGCDSILGSVSDLLRNLSGLADAAGLDANDRTTLSRLTREKVNSLFFEDFSPEKIICWA